MNPEKKIKILLFLVGLCLGAMIMSGIFAIYQPPRYILMKDHFYVDRMMVREYYCGATLNCDPEVRLVNQCKSEDDLYGSQIIDGTTGNGGYCSVYIWSDS